MLTLDGVVAADSLCLLLVIVLTLDGVVAADSLVVGSSTLRLSDAESSYEGKYQFSIKLLLFII